MRPPSPPPARVLATLACAGALAGCAGSTFTLIEENDAISLKDRGDRNYTQGLRAAWVFPAESAPEPARRLAAAARTTDASTEAIGLFVGQEIYTPRDIGARRLQRTDRPYAGWLYGGLVVANVERPEDGPTGDRLDSYELQVGMVGPSSFGRFAQVHVHRMMNSPHPRGWRHQLADEPGLVLSYEGRERLVHGGGDGAPEWDGIGGMGGSLGNVFTHAQASLTVRLGNDLPRDFGVNTIHRSVAEVGPPGDDPKGLRWYLFATGQGRIVARNIFLDGNTFEDSHHVERENAVAQGAVGVALHLGRWRLTFTQNVRTREFAGQEADQHFGSVSLQLVLDL